MDITDSLCDVGKLLGNFKKSYLNSLHSDLNKSDTRKTLDEILARQDRILCAIDTLSAREGKEIIKTPDQEVVSTSRILSELYSLVKTDLESLLASNTMRSSQIERKKHFQEAYISNRLSSLSTEPLLLQGYPEYDEETQTRLQFSLDISTAVQMDPSDGIKYLEQRLQLLQRLKFQDTELWYHIPFFKFTIARMLLFRLYSQADVQLCRVIDIKHSDFARIEQLVSEFLEYYPGHMALVIIVKSKFTKQDIILSETCE
jgi:hypothetical protein